MPTLQEVYQCDHPVALVTGSGSPRVGRVVADRLARLGCGIALHANTSLTDAQQEADRLREEVGCNVIVTSGSLEDASVPDRLVQETNSHFGRIDILVNSAAIWRPTKLNAITPQQVQQYFQINTIAPLFCARAAALKMAEQTAGGSIVNIGDWATTRPYLDHAAYFPSKGAVETMTRSLAVEFAQLHANIRVNCVQPGPVLLADDVSQQDAQRIAASTLVGRVGTATHVAHAVQFLCENDFVTGVCLPVDGGRRIYASDGLQVGLNSG